MAHFVGRRRELAALNAELDQVRRSGEGRFAWVRGRRRVGKSRLVQEFLGRQDVPYVFYQAPRRQRTDALERFRLALQASTLPAATAVAQGAAFNSWPAALQLAASGASSASPSVIVLDELPYLVEKDSGFPADLQMAWDQHLQHLPVMLIAIGSDVRMMRTLTEYPAELHDRPTREIAVPPFSVREIATLSGISAEQAFDRYLVVGGFPALARSWPASLTRRDFLERSLADSTNALVVNAQRIVDAEFEADVQARDVLEAIGNGEVSFSTISRATGIGQESPRSLSLALETLMTKGLVEGRLPYAAPPGRRDRRYVIVDPYLRFWLRFLGPSIDEIDRGRTDLVVNRIERDWTSFRGKAIEPLIAASVERLLPDQRFGAARYVGSYWTRNNRIEVDLVGAAEKEPKTVAFVGSIKWRENAVFARSDVDDLRAHRANVPEAEAALLVGVSRSGFGDADLDVKLTADDLLAAWPEP
jgi:AAA+ ATPase superfamily predicted ATPase